MGRRNIHSGAQNSMQVVLVNIGSAPRTVVQLLMEVMSLTITDLEALDAATPLILFEELAQERAAKLQWRFQLAGANVELRKPRLRHQGIRRPLFTTRPNPRKAA